MNGVKTLLLTIEIQVCIIILIGFPKRYQPLSFICSSMSQGKGEGKAMDAYSSNSTSDSGLDEKERVNLHLHPPPHVQRTNAPCASVTG